MQVTRAVTFEQRCSHSGGVFHFMAQETTAPATFEQNAFYERLITMRRTNRKAFESMSPGSKLALAQYEKLKRENLQMEDARHG